MTPGNFLLGTHQVDWLGKTRVPLLVSHSRLRVRKSFHRARGPWAIDSGAFTEISQHGSYRETDAEYVGSVRRYIDEVGWPVWAAIRDFMCEPFVLAKTGKSILEHQRLTVQSLLTLTDLAPEVPWLPTLQGWQLGDYLRCAEIYDRAGVRLRGRCVGVGSVCRRQGSREAEGIVRGIAAEGLAIHAFGFKIKGLLRASDAIYSADSAAWSLHARKRKPLPGHTHVSCGNCITYALRWRRRVVNQLREAN